MKNIVLIGMPGCGKTTVGWLVAKKLGMRFADTDDIIERKAGKTPGEIIREQGEAAFRELEKAAVVEACSMNYAIIATGGGAVLCEENITELRKNGVIVFLQRDINNLSHRGRPLSDNIEYIYNKRINLYNNACDFTINGNNGAKAAAEELIRKNEAFNRKRPQY